MKNIIITGTSGMIGKLILENCLQRNDVKMVTSITRKTLGIQHPKLIEIIHNDFLDYATLEEKLKNQDVCFYCIGVYTGKVPTAEFQKITVTYTEVFARALKKNSNSVSFCFLSGQGADSTENSKVLFAKEKGIAENILLKLQFNRLYIFRPAYIYPVTSRVEPNLIYKIMRFLYNPIKLIFPNFTVNSIALANKMVMVAFEQNSKIIYENIDIRK